MGLKTHNILISFNMVIKPINPISLYMGFLNIKTLIYIQIVKAVSLWAVFP
jgi:hypothetical protein